MNHSNCKVSIVIPVHNTSAYLHRCFDSCLNQTLHDIEVIVVDDCSTDNSREIIDVYAKRFPQFHAIYLEENLRQGGARNIGIKASAGEYILFVDSDDWIELNTCERLYHAANGADLVGSNHYISTDTKDTKNLLPYTNADIGIMSMEKRLAVLDQYGYFWTRLFRREFLISNKLTFPMGIFYEDAFFNFATFLYAKKFIKIEDYLYHYYQRNGSSVNNKNQVRQYDRIIIANLIYDFFKEQENFLSVQSLVEKKFLLMMSQNIINICFSCFDCPDRAKVTEICHSIKTRMPHYRTSSAYKSLDNLTKYYMSISMWSPSLALFLYNHHVYEYYTAMKKKLKP